MTGVRHHIGPFSTSSVDEDLVKAFQEGRDAEAAFFEIVRRYKQKVYFHCRKMLIDHDDADDAAQNTFIRVWENLAAFRNDSKLYSWIYRIATNEALSVLRRKKPGISLDDALPEMAELVDRDPWMDGDHIQRRLQQALTSLPFKQKLVFVLKYFEEMTYDEISEVTETSVGALKASYFHAVRKLEEILQRPV